MNMADSIDLFPARVRALQAMYHDAHQALVNWGLWSRDTKGMKPVEVSPPPTWREANTGLPGGYADETVGPKDDGLEAKPERAEDDPYDELRGFILDERMHGPGGLPMEIRNALKVAYVYRYVREEHYCRQAGCCQDAFCERLEAGLMFAGRFV